MNTKLTSESENISFLDFKSEVLNDYRIATESREASLLGRKEVLTGKAKFGIFGDGKELPQIAMAKAFKNGDWRSGYYRDQTFMLAAGMITLKELFAQLYANPNIKDEPSSGGRQMNAHFATRIMNENGDLKDLTNIKITSADSSPTAGQMTRALGLALASKLYRANAATINTDGLSVNGNEVCFVTIGDASTSEGHFWETINAAGVLKVPLAVNVWDDGYGISVPKKFQTTKGSISKALAGFELDENGEGYIFKVVKAWDYPSLCKAYIDGIAETRTSHTPILFHVEEVTQPQGHSTSGSHERYKSKERLEWEKEFDGIKKFKEWILTNSICEESELLAIEEAAKKSVLAAKQAAWEAFIQPIKVEINEAVHLIDELIDAGIINETIDNVKNHLSSLREPFRKDIVSGLRKIIASISNKCDDLQNIIEYNAKLIKDNKFRYTSNLHSSGPKNALLVKEVPVEYDNNAPTMNGFEILNHFFDETFKNNSLALAFGEDLGNIGDVNQGFAGLQLKYGDSRIFDTGIREATIMGQGVGLALRGFRPIAEIQYLDYLLYGLQVLSDDLATLQYRTAGGQCAPLIIRTRGHRLEGIWHTGSPMQMILGSLRGMYVCVPRNMTQAAGMYQTLLQSNEPGLVIECLNGYRLKEKLPSNLGQFNVPLGKIEVLEKGTDVTIVTYGSCVKIALDAMELLNNKEISIELIDVQTLLPFDTEHEILNSLKKTNRILFLDEDVPGGGTAYMMQQVIDIQGGFYYLDTPAKCLSAVANRTAFGTDGDYFCKPSADDIYDAVIELMSI
jgi:pyruvate/2-oxoglutarate/acetoin dehydrogenase E1 component/TPP-dependent pyruvate/acetoin dehydrogenase alpha subunit